MKPLLPVFCRPMGYVVILLAAFLPLVMMLLGRVTDANLVFYRECSKLLVMLGALMIIFAYTRDEGKETERLRCRATRNAIFITVAIVFGDMLLRVAQGDATAPVDSSSFVVYLLVHVLCLEFSIKKEAVSRAFKRSGR